MEYNQGIYLLKSKKNLAKNCYDFTIACPEIANVAKPGQFVHVKVNGFTLRRPISICEIDKENGTIRIVFEVRGEGTEELSKATTVVDVLGPLGKGFTILEKTKKAIVIGGGIGTPPMLEVAKQYNENATAIIGFRSADAVVLEDDFKAVHANTILCTDDGTKGQKGFVTAALSDYLKENKVDIIYACGPKPMLKGIVEIADECGIKCEVSLEERMGCGVGACLVCACKTVKEGKEFYSHVCKDGPVFDSKEVIL